MANSESEDFESADEEITKAPENESHHLRNGVKFEPASDQTSTNGSSLPQTTEVFFQSASLIGSKESNLDRTFASMPQGKKQSSHGPPVELPSLNPQNYDPESLGAKPKVFQKSKSKPHSKHRSLRESEATSTEVNFSSNLEPAPKSKIGPMKLGVKMSSRIPSQKDDSPDRNKFKSKGKSKVTWCNEISKTDTDNQHDIVNQDLHNSMQPLVDKLVSLEVTDTSEQVSNEAFTVIS